MEDNLSAPFLHQRHTGRVSIRTGSTDNPEVSADGTSDWKDIIFLPFNDYWELLLMTSIVINFLNQLYDSVFDFEHISFQKTLYYFFETIYFADTLAVIAHRNMILCRRKRYHTKKSMFQITISVITLIPIKEIFIIFNEYMWDKDVTSYSKYVYVTSLVKSTLRLFQLVSYFKNKRNEVGLHQVTLILFEHFTKLILITSVLTSIWYGMSCWKCTEPNWTIYLKKYIFDPNIGLDWAVVCFHIVASIIAHNWTGVITAVTFNERLFIIGCMTVGFVMHIMVFFGGLTAAFLQIYRHQYEYSTRLKKIMYLLNDWRVEKSVKKRTVDYYKLFWNKRRGIKGMPQAFELLPLSLRKEVSLDIFWEALRHSHMFAGLDISFKRSVSLVMKNEFLLPGDYVYRMDEPKTKMTYIVSGLIQILSEEDDESPIVTFTSGTVLGEFSCLMYNSSKINCKCSTFCEVQTLSMFDLYHVLLEFPHITKELYEHIGKRLDYAHWAKSDQVPPRDLLKDEKTRPTSIMLLKSQYRFIVKHMRSRKMDDLDWSYLDRSFTSDYLDSLVITDDTETKVDAICLRSDCPFVMDNQSSFRKFLSYFVITAVLLQVIILPYPIFYEGRIPDSLFWITTCLDVVYLLDVYFQLSTSLKISNDRTFVEPGQIVLHRFKDGAFTLDVLSILPYCSLLKFFGLSERVTIVFVSFRFLKIYKVFQFIAEKERQLSVHSLYIRLVKYMLLCFLIVYLSSCILYATSCFYKTCFPNNWFVYNRNIRFLRAYPPFAKTLFYAMSIVLNLSLSDNNVFSIPDMILIVILIYVGYIFYSFSFSELAAAAVLYIKESCEHQDEIIIFTAIMKRRRVDIELKYRLLNILEFNWRFNEGAEIHGKNAILSKASYQIKTEIINVRIINCLKLVPLFNNCAEGLLQKLSLQAEVMILPAGTYIQNINVMSHSVYIILRGYCQMKSMLPGDSERNSKLILKRGDMLALIETLHRVRMFGSIESVTAVELLCVSYDVFSDIFQSYRNEHMYLHNALKKHMEDYESILMRKGCRMPPMKSVKPALGRVDTFSYKVYKDERSIVIEEEYKKPFFKLGHWSFIRFFLLKESIDPNGKFFIVWEIIRCIFAFADILSSLLFLNVLFNYRKPMLVLMFFFRLTCIADIYVRLHCHYYNEKGILVTHPLSTATYYLQTSFLTDLIPAIPVNTIRFGALINKNYLSEISIILRLTLRPIQLHRFFSGLSILHERMHWSSVSMMLKFKSTIILVIFLGIVSNVLMIITCRFHKQGFECRNTTFVAASIFENQIDPTSVFIYSMYYIVSIFANTSCGVFGVNSQYELVYFIVIVIILFFVRAIILATFTSSGIGGNVNLSTFRARMKQFLNFSREVLLDDALIRETIEHYEHVWKETLGTDINMVSSKFNLYLRIQFVLFLYETSIRNTDLFSMAPSAIVQRLVPCLKEIHFKRGANIIRCNDVQKNVYFVYKGKVDVTVANTVLTTLDIGGMFGCFLKQGITRQTIAVTAKTHAIVLELDSQKLHEILEEWDEKTTEAILKNIRLLSVEYMEPKETLTDSFATLDRYQNNTSLGKYGKMIQKLNLVITKENKWYWLYEYVLNVHVSAISSIIVMANMCVGVKEQNELGYKIFFYFIDVVFLTKIFFGFHLNYTNHSTGIKVTDSRQIIISYLKTNFALHLVTCIPFELFLAIFHKEYTKLGTLNRVLRFLYFYQYYNACKLRLNVSKHLRWSYICYWAIFRVQLMANIWFLTACFNKKCKYVVNRLGRPRILKQANSTMELSIIGYTYILAAFTSTGLRDAIPTTIPELLVSMLIALFSQFMIANLSSGYANMILLDNNTRSNYEHRINKIKIYLKGRYLSPSIFEKVWVYLVQLWKLQQGEWMPRLISEAPGYLKQDIMFNLYGYHLENHFLFSKAHKDFIRQLMTLLQRRVYLPGNVIVEKGDMDNTMYFVHSGEIGAYDRHGSNEIPSYIVKSEMAFGEAQGLYSVPYKLTYKSHTIVVILALNKSDWFYLLKWFPATAEQLTMKANEYGLLNPTTYTSQYTPSSVRVERRHSDTYSKKSGASSER